MQSLPLILAITKTQVCETNVTERNVIWSNVETEQSCEVFNSCAFSLRYCHASLSWLQRCLGAVFRKCDCKYLLNSCCMLCTVDTVLSQKHLVPTFLKSYALVENAADIKKVIEICWILWKTSLFQGYLTHLGRKTLVTSCYQYAFLEHISSLNFNVWLLVFCLSHPFLNQSLFQNKFECRNSFLAFFFF